MSELVCCDQAHPGEAVVARVAAAFLADGVLVMPTDSVYGIGCAAVSGNPAHGRVFAIKRREPSQTLPWLVSDAADLERYGQGAPAWVRALARELWPGALTLVVRSSDEVPAEYRRKGDGTIALRMPDSNLVRLVARRVGCPLAVTSANTHGAPAPTSAEGLESRIVAEADLTIDGGACPAAVASTIVGVSAAGGPVVFREGAVPAGCVMRLCREA